MSQFQIRLLEKIEELTLYKLVQHAEIKTLQQANTELKAQLKMEWCFTESICH